MMLAKFLAVFAFLLAAAPFAGADLDFPPYPLVQPGPAFDSMHDKAAATNQPGVSFVLRTIGGRTQYQCGERIQVQFVISSRVKNEYHCDRGEGRRDGWNTDVFVCDASAGAADPFTSSYLVVHGNVAGDRMEVLDFINKPHIDTMDLNEWVAFDKPGMYRVYAITRRVYKIGSKGQVPNDAELNGGPPTTSTVLTLTITPTEEAWEQKVIAAALAPYHKPWDDVLEQRGALLHYLRTKDAADALVHEMVSDHTYQYPSDKDYYESECSEYLMESPHRDEMIFLMERDIADPDIPITQTFLDTYCALLIYRAFPTKVPEKLRDGPGYKAIATRALSMLTQALPAKRGAAKEVSRQTVKTFDKACIGIFMVWD